MKLLTLSDERTQEPLDLRQLLEIDTTEIDFEPLRVIDHQSKLIHHPLARAQNHPYKSKSVLTCKPSENT